MLSIEYMPLEEVVKRYRKRNPKEHDLGLLHQLVGKFGFADPMLVDERDDGLIAGHGRTDTLIQMFKDNPDDPPEHVVSENGTWKIPVVRGWASNNAPEAEAFVTAHNQSVIAGGYDDVVLAEVLQDAIDTDTLVWTGFDEGDVDNLLESLQDKLDFDAAVTDKPPSKRQLPLDVIYTLQGADCTCCLAVQAGLKYGIQTPSFRLCPYTHELTGRHEVCFVDNDYWDYSHARHSAVVHKIKPKYATVRDVMNKGQCKEAGIDWYSFDQILDWAEELAASASNVIVIPKYDCIDHIPEEFILGYSIPTSHGGTPLSVDAFKGRRVHLLGGSWKQQLRYLAEFGDDVVSLDNNYIAKVARFGQYVDGAGHSFALKESGFEALNNPTYSALALTFGAIGHRVSELQSEIGEK